MARHFYLLLLPIVLVFGCGSASLVGHYRGELTPTDSSQTALARLADQLVRFELKEDGTFTLAVTGELKGTYTIQGDRIKLEVTEVKGRPVRDLPAKVAALNRPIYLRIAEGGRELIPESDLPGMLNNVKIKLVRI